METATRLDYQPPPERSRDAVELWLMHWIQLADGMNGATWTEWANGTREALAEYRKLLRHDGTQTSS